MFVNGKDSRHAEGLMKVVYHIPRDTTAYFHLPRTIKRFTDTKSQVKNSCSKGTENNSNLFYNGQNNSALEIKSPERLEHVQTTPVGQQRETVAPLPPPSGVQVCLQLCSRNGLPSQTLLSYLPHCLKLFCNESL